MWTVAFLCWYCHYGPARYRCVLDLIVRTGEMEEPIIHSTAGKSYCSIYVLLRCLALKKQVGFAAANGRLYWFNEGLVYWATARSIFGASIFKPPHGLTSPNGLPRTWFIFDLSYQRAAIRESSVFYDQGFFFVIFSPPMRMRYERLTERFTDSATLWIMPSWSVRELRCL